MLIGIGVGVIAIQGMSPDEMPPDQRAYWRWVSSINRGESDMALASGLELLAENPQIRPLYLRLAELCLKVEAVAACQDALNTIQPSSSLTRLYREAALALLDQDEAITPWQQLARAPEIDPTLARLIVDQMWPESVETVEAAWKHQFDIDSTAVGAIFGLGYAAVRRYEWTPGEDMLALAVLLKPDDPLIYRELGRIYFATQQPDKLERVVKAGIEAAEVQYDLEQELILRGNLGWTMFQRSGDLKEAGRLITRALEQARTLALGRTEGYNLYRLANVFLQQNRFDEVIPLLRSADILYAQHAPHRHAEVVALHGSLLNKMFRFSEAERVFEQAIVEAEETGHFGVQAEALMALTNLRLRMGRYTAARGIGEEALALVKRLQLRGSEIVVRFTLGDVERIWGNHGEASAHYMRAAELSRKAKNEVTLRDAFYRLGVVALDVRDINTAKMYFEEMVRSLEDAGHANRLALAYLGLGHIYSRFQNLPEALRYYNLAQEQLAQLTEEDLYLRASIRTSKAWVLLQMEAYAQAEALFNEAQRIDPATLSLAYEVEVGLGDAAFSQGQCEEALQHVQKAGAIALRQPNPGYHWYALFIKALSHWCLGDLPQAERA
ncbi:MAG: tetratricopeptide repeat protein, partial [Rhodothermales bacterium]